MYEWNYLNALKNIFFYRLTGLNFLLAIVTASLTQLSEFFYPVTFLLLSNLFDILGYHFTLIRRTTVMPENEIIKAYRINQLMFDVLLLAFIVILSDWITAAASAMLKLTGVQDVTYYIFLKKPLPVKWTWLKWTPLGLFRKVLTKYEVILQAASGLIIAFVLIFIYS